jgi:hypothetical protein
MIVYCSCNEAYIPKVKTLYNSLKENSNIDFKFYTRTVGFDPKNYKFFLNKNCIETDISLNKEKNLTSLDGHLYSEEQAYSAKIRMVDIYNLLQNTTEDVLSLDADSIVRKSLSKMYSVLGNKDILIKQTTYTKKTHYKIKAGVILTQNTPNSLKFFKEVKSYLETNNNMFTWFSEQIGLYNAYKLNIAQLAQLPDSYIDWNFNDESIIWTAKGDTKNNQTYINEEQKYDY